MDASSVGIAILVLFAGSLVQAACGFGFAVVVMGVLARLMPTYGEAAGLSNLLIICMSAYIAFGLRGHIRWKTILWPLLTYAPVSLLMVRFVAADAGGLMQKLLGAALIALGVYMIFFQGKLVIPQTPVSGLVTGAVSGVLGGLFCMAGVPMAVYMLSMEQKEDYLATIQTFFLIVAVYSAFIHSASGFLSGEVLRLTAYCAAPVILGSVLGKRFFQRVNRETVKKVIYGFMLVSGAYLMLA